MNYDYNKVSNIVKKLIKQNKTVSTMESCTGGAVANVITTIEGSSKVIKFSAVTYSNEYKIKMGVNSKIIDQYSVYSIETAKEMSLRISEFTNSDYGIGITGKLNKSDEDNKFGDDSIVFVSIYDKEKNSYVTGSIEAIYSSRELNKIYITNVAIELLSNVI